MKQFSLLVFFTLLLNFNITAQNSAIVKPIDSTRLITKYHVYKNSEKSASTEINASAFNKGAIFSTMQLIGGKMPGLAVMRTRGNDPNQVLQIELPGKSSFFLGAEPLYLIDGIAVESPDIIMPEDIESIGILRNTSETAPYGIRGSNGVILINTYKGNSNKLSVSYSSYGYIEKISNKSDFLTASEWRLLKQDWANRVIDPSLWSPDYPSISNSMIDYGASTNWLDEISQAKLSQSHNLSFSGNKNKTSYYVALNYKDMNGVIKKNDKNTYNGYISVSQLLLNNKLTISLTLTGTKTEFSHIIKPRKPDSKSNIVSIAESYNPTVQMNSGNQLYYNGSYYTSPPTLQLNNMTDQWVRDNLLADFRVDYKIFHGLRIIAGYSQNRLNEENDYLFLSIRDSVNTDRSLSNTLNNKSVKTATAGLHYTKKFNFHQIDFSLDYTNFHRTEEYDRQDSSFYLNHLNYRAYYSGSAFHYNSLISISFDYNFLKKYYFSSNLSHEKSNTYFLNPSIKRSLLFPSFSAAWNISNEDFLKNSYIINSLTLNLGYGKSFRGLSSYNSFEDHFFHSNQFSVAPNLHGEEIKEANLGFDIELLSKYMVSFDLFNRYNNDVVYQYSVGIPAGATYGFIENGVTIRNRGLYLLLNAHLIKSKSITWMVHFNFSKTKSTFLYAGNLSEPKVDDEIGSIYGRKFAGFSERSIVLNYDEDGNISTRPFQQVIGQNVPDSFLGLTNNLIYKNFDLSFSLRGAMGFNIRNLNRYETTRATSSHGNFSREIQLIDPRVVHYGDYLAYNYDFYIEKGDFLKVDDITLGYCLKPKVKYISNALLYLTCNNCFAFTRFTGWDPEMAGITGPSAGVYSYNSYPVTRIFVLGLKIVFKNLVL